MKTTIGWTIGFIMVLVLFVGTAFEAAAQNKVVVIPLVETPTGPPALIPKTGQTTCSDEAGVPIPCDGTGQDGDIQAGVAWPNPRFVDHGNGTVTDKLTGLIWLKKGDCNRFYLLDPLSGQSTSKWPDAINRCNLLSSGACDLTDLSQAGDWRLPNFRESLSLIDLGHSDPALPANCPVEVRMDDYYWSATTSVSNPDNAWRVFFRDGIVNKEEKSVTYFVRCVR